MNKEVDDQLTVPTTAREIVSFTLPPIDAPKGTGESSVQVDDNRYTLDQDKIQSI